MSPPAAGRSQRWVLACIALAAFITSFDNTVINIALPSVRADLGLSLAGLEWVVTSYILVFSSLLLVGGRLTDLLGRRTALIVGYGVFSSASLAAGLATSGEALIGARIVQGSGAALILPASLALLSHDLDGEARDLGAGVWTAAIALALFLGPLAGGAISQYSDWSWIFLINVPVGIGAVLMVMTTVPARKVPPPGRTLDHLDLPGLVLSTVALLALTYALVQGNEHGFGSPSIVGAFALSLIAAMLFVACEQRARFPLVNVALFRNRVFAGGTAASVLWGLSINGVFFFTSLFLQDVLLLSPIEAGLMFLPLAVSLVIGVSIAPQLVTRHGANVTVSAGMVLIAIGLTPIIIRGHDSGVLEQLLGIVIVGFGSGLTTPLTSAMLGVVPADRVGVGSAVVAVSREVSGVLGVAIIGAVVAARQASALAAGSPPADAFLDGHITGLIGATIVVSIGAIVAWFTLPRSRAEGLAMSIPTVPIAGATPVTPVGAGAQATPVDAAHR